MALHALPSADTKPRKALRTTHKGLRALGAALHRPASIARDHLVEHGYFFAAAGCADAAGFVHSVFTGLIVMAVSFLAIEWRASRGA